MLPSGAHPMYLVMAAIGIITGLYTLQDHEPRLIPALFVFGVILLGLRVYMLLAERRRRRDSRAVVDYDLLRRGDIASKVPEIKEALRGHDEVVIRVAARIQRNLGLALPGRSLGAFLFVGPTGTGKTYLGELFAEALYPKSSLIHLRMNQYKDHQDVSTLIGPPPGYQGYEIGGALTRPVIENPYRVIILDEFEKSHPDVRHCFFDIFDKAQCVEKSSGKTAHFEACAFFATCNEGADNLRQIWSEVGDPIQRTGRARDALASGTFDKALLARFDEIVFMDMLPSVVIAEVACLQIVKYWKQYEIDVFYAAPELLAETVRRNVEFAQYGVRELARQIQEHTTPGIETARREGAKLVRLSVDAKKESILVEAA